MPNITLNPMSGGSVVATETISAADYQFFKLVDGTAASTNKLIINSAGAASVSNSDIIASGSLTALNAAATTATLQGVDTAGIQITGTWVGTVTFEGTIDGTNWFAINGTTFASTGALVSTATANGQWQVDIGGVQLFRVRMSAFTSGTAVVTVRASYGTSAIALDAPIPAGTNIMGKVGIDQTTIGTTNAVSIAQIGATTIVTGGVCVFQSKAAT